MFKGFFQVRGGWFYYHRDILIISMIGSLKEVIFYLICQQVECFENLKH